ncbi:MAG TPA: hypothetical protein VLL05_17245 [Terriglobales bacterium]|nr:hypothetical protein [Terriglobales bacterium]
MLIDAAIFHSNRYHAGASCEHCGGLIRHENWCITSNERVFYAYEVVLDPGKLQLTDRLILHALGVIWTSCTCCEA